MRKFIFFLMLIALFPISQAFAQDPTVSTGCAAMVNFTDVANPTLSFGPDDFFAGETITVTVSGAGTDFTLSEDGASVGAPSPALIGETLTYEVAADGTFTYSVDVTGVTDLTTTATLNCEPAATGDDDDDDGKVTICHRPPGNPDAAHTITVGAPAESAHLAHGDEPGECPDGIDSEEEGEGGVTFFVLDESGEVEVWGACTVADDPGEEVDPVTGIDPDDLDEDSEGTGADCSLLALVDVSQLEPVDGFSLEFDEDPDDDFYVIVWYLGQSSEDDTLAVYQINVYENDLLLDDSLLIFVDADGVIADWGTHGE